MYETETACLEDIGGRFDQLFDGDNLHFVIRAASLAASLRPVLDLNEGIYEFNLPLMTALCVAFIPRAITYATGINHVEDAEAHKDLVGPHAVNVLYTVEGSSLAGFARIPDELHDSGGGLLTNTVDEIRECPSERVNLKTGDIVFFLGGVVTHKFASAQRGRLSLMKHYDKAQ
jgi:hypothetical protein